MAENMAEKAEEEIASLKKVYGSDMKVIKNIGDFRYVVDIKLKDIDIAIKFQLDENYPDSPAHVIVKSKMMELQQRENLSLYLTSEAAHLAGNIHTKTLIEAIKPWLDEHHINLSLSPNISPVNKRKKGEKKKKKKSEEEEDAVVEKQSMKTAVEVISRIIWDDVPRQHFLIGYLDRFLGVIEKNFGDFSWENIASVDNDTLAIPKHRIQYFKYKDVKVWDKNIRLDNVFGSTGSGITIREVIDRYDTQERMRYGENAPVVEDDIAGMPYGYEDQEIMNETDENRPKIEFLGLGVEDPGPNPADNASGFVPGAKRAEYWGAKNRPTHFLALRITDVELMKTVGAINETIMDMRPDYASIIIPPNRLHVTLCCLGLDTQDQVETAAQVLDNLQKELKTWNPQDIKIEFEKIDHFFNKVLHVKVKETEPLLNFVDHLRLCVREEGIEIRDVFDFTPHMTLLKLSKAMQRDSRCPYLDSRIFSVTDTPTFGSQGLTNIHLCEMSDMREDDGFYVTPTKILFE